MQAHVHQIKNYKQAIYIYIYIYIYTKICLKNEFNIQVL
jgi:hypothetical protein